MKAVNWVPIGPAAAKASEDFLFAYTTGEETSGNVRRLEGARVSRREAAKAANAPRMGSPHSAGPTG